MAHGSPDWVRRVEVVVIVENVPVPSVPAKERAAGGIGRYSGTDTTYQTVKSWTVASKKVGEIKELILFSSNYDKTHFKVTIGDVTFCSDTLVPAATPLVFDDLKLEAGKEVKVECKSTDETSITADAVIVGKEIG